MGKEYRVVIESSLVFKDGENQGMLAPEPIVEYAIFPSEEHYKRFCGAWIAEVMKERRKRRALEDELQTYRDFFAKIKTGKIS